MVGIAQSILFTLPLAVQIQGWSIVPISDANCMADKTGQTHLDRGEGVSGDDGKSSKGNMDWCMNNVPVKGMGQGVRSLEVGGFDSKSGKWEDGCQIAIWASNECYDPDSTEAGEPPEQLEDESDEDYQEVLDAWEEGNHFVAPRKIFTASSGNFNESTGTYCIPGVDVSLNMVANPPMVVDIVYDCEGKLEEA